MPFGPKVRTKTLRLLGFMPAVMLVLCFLPRSASADLLDDVLGVAASIGMIDDDVVRSKPLIECLLGGGNALTCSKAVTNVQQEAVKMLPATDSNIKLIVDLVQAAADERWLRVIELTGVNGVVIACKLVPGGKLSQFFCSGLAQDVLNVMQDEFKVVYGAVVDGDWWELVTIIRPELVPKVCSVLLPGEVKVVVCDGLLKAIGFVIDAFEEGLDLVGEFFVSMLNVLSGPEDPPKDAKSFYDSWWRMGNLHWMVLEGLTQPGTEIGVWPSSTHAYCVTYYDSHRMQKSDAEKLCQQMGDSLLAEAKAYKALAIDSVPAYLKGALLPRRYAIAAGSWGDIPAAGVIQPGTVEIKDLYLACLYDVGKTFKSLPNFSTVNGQQPTKDGSVQNWICQRAVNQQFLPQLTTAKAELQKNILAPLTHSKTGGRLGLPQAAECTLQTAYNKPYLVTRCDTFEKWRNCRSIYFDLGIDMAAKGAPICDVNDLVAGKKLAAEIAAALGSRCTSSGHTVECTREWKVPACHARVGDVMAGLPYRTYQPQCKFKSTPAYDAAKNKAIQILNGLNGAGPFEIGPGGQAIPTTVFSADKACYSLPDPLVLKCKGSFSIPDTADVKLQFCKKDPNNLGVDEPCYLDLPNAKAVTTSPAMPVTPANQCRYEATYYEPLPPVIEASSSSAQVGDQLQVRCAFETRTKIVEWPQCDDFAKNAIEVMKLAAVSGSRYSGQLVVDGNTVGVTSSAQNGGDFARTGLWSFDEAGTHEILCKVDNGLRPSETDAPVYLESGVTLDVGGARGTRQYRSFDPASARRLATTPIVETQLRRAPKK